MTQRRPRIGTAQSVSRSPRPDFAAAEAFYASIRDQLEDRHFGSYVMINPETLEYVVAGTASQTHENFIEKFGENQRGWCTRIEASAFATA